MVATEDARVSLSSILIGVVQLLCAAGLVVAAVHELRWGVGLGIAALMASYMWRRSLEEGYRGSKGFRVHLTVVALGLVFALASGLRLI